VKKFTWIYAVFAVLIGGLVAPPVIVVRAQDRARDQQPSQHSEISDRDLKAFAKAYVEFRKIRSAYENSLNEVGNRQEESKAQHEALIKIDRALEKQGLRPDALYRIFKAVNADEKLYAKAMKLIEEEQRAAS
jgi:Domain of unknown function (DUF4168)